MLRERDAHGRIIQGGDEVRDALAVTRADEAVRILRRDLPHHYEELAAAVRPRLEGVREGRDLVVALPE